MISQLRERFPQAQQIPAADLQLYQVRSFLSPDECAILISEIEARRRPSTIADDNNDPLFRTSETCDLDSSGATVAMVNNRISDMLGIDPQFGEIMQGQRYAAGQEFKAHTDYFEPNGRDYGLYCSEWGQRTWTAMVYLNAPETGGATRFKLIDKIVRPEPGKLLCWNNRLADGQVNPATLHQGMKVRTGTKYIITKWYRERAVQQLP